MRMIWATERAMQYPNSMPEIMNLWPLRRLSWSRVMFAAAAIR